MADETPQSSIVLYQTEDGRTRVQCRFEDETIWLTQAQIGDLFQVTPQNVTLHLKSIFDEGELNEAATCKDYLQVRREGSRATIRKFRIVRSEASAGCTPCSDAAQTTHVQSKSCEVYRDKRNHHAVKSAAERHYLRSPQRELWVSRPTAIQPRSGDISNEGSRRRSICRRSAAEHRLITFPQLTLWAT